MRLVGPMNLHVPMVNAFSKDGVVIVMMIAVIQVMKKIVRHHNAMNTVSVVPMDYVFRPNGVVMEIQTVQMDLMKEYVELLLLY